MRLVLSPGLGALPGICPEPRLHPSLANKAAATSELTTAPQGIVGSLEGTGTGLSSAGAPATPAQLAVDIQEQLNSIRPLRPTKFGAVLDAVALLNALRSVKDNVVRNIDYVRHGRPARLEQRRDDGVEIYSLDAGGDSARVHVDPHTLGLVRGLPKGASVRVFGSQALDMFSDDGFIARTGRLRPGSDIDLIVRANNESVRRAFPDNQVDIEPAYAAKLNPYSIGVLRLRFESLGAGEFRLSWDSSARAAAEAWADWRAKIVRHVAGKRLSLRQAMVALVYVARYGAALEPRTAQRMRDAFLGAAKRLCAKFSWAGPGSDIFWDKEMCFIMSMEKRFLKAYASAPDPADFVRLLADMGVLDVPLYVIKLGAPKPGPTARELLADPEISLARRSMFHPELASKWGH